MSGAFTSQYEFDTALHRLISRGNDGHLQVGLCSLEIFRFEHGVPLVSISTDGTDIPHLYTYSDALIKHQQRAQAVSEIVEINGLEANYYLQSQIAITLGYQDPDARYNALFPSPTAGFTGMYAGGAWASNLGVWPGADIFTISFANGTRAEVKPTSTWPVTNGPMNFSDADDLFQAACVPNPKSKHVFGSVPGMYLGPPAHQLPPSGSDAYPEPERVDTNGLVRGYYLDSASLPDVCVLQIATFHIGQGSLEFLETTQEFLEQATRDGKRKLLLDLSGNGGGDVIPGLNLFRILFPAQPIYSATRFRSTELLNILGEIFSLASSGASTEPVLDPPLAFQSAVGPDQEKHPFSSWEDLFGPDKRIQGDNMSSLYAVFDLDAASTSLDPISGYGPVQSSTAPGLFEPENILVVTDGRCASTCAILVGLLQAQGVRTLAFGGRPRRAPMQAVGGVKGGQRWSLRTISRHIRTARELLDKERALAAAQPSTGRQHAVEDLIRRLDDLAPPALPLSTRQEDDYLEWEFALRFDTYGQSSVNFRDAYKPGMETTPWQFLYEAADCRLFLTLENVMDPASQWASAARAIFGDDESGSRKCVSTHND